MYLRKDAALKIDNTYWIGTLKGFDFDKQHPILKDDFDEDTLQFTLDKYFDIKGIDKKYSDIIKIKYGADEIYILEKRSRSKDNGWKKRNEKCLSCKKKCKQSAMVDVYYCKSFKEK